MGCNLLPLGSYSPITPEVFLQQTTISVKESAHTLAYV